VISSLARPYLAVAGARFRLLLQYRAAALAGSVTQCWWGAIKIMVLTAFYSGAATTPMTLRQTIDYIWLAQAFLRLLPWSVDPDVTRMVRTGDVLYERLRPVDAHTFWYARAVALKTASPLLRNPGDRPDGHPLSLNRALGMGAVATGGNERGAPVRRLDGARRRARIGDIDANGHPNRRHALRPWSQHRHWAARDRALREPHPAPPLPRLAPAHACAPAIRRTGHAPFRIYAGHLTGAAALAALARQAVWTLILIALGRLLMTRVMARVQVQGG
jgi:ABC-2 type transport system permease protein